MDKLINECDRENFSEMEMNSGTCEYEGMCDCPVCPLFVMTYMG